MTLIVAGPLHQCATSCVIVNKSVCLSVSSEEEQRGVVSFLWAEGAKCAEIHMLLWAQYGDNPLPC